jgi:hypothetical protein
MIEKKGDMFEVDADVWVVTTNGFVTSNGFAVMGRGCAKTVSELIPSIKKELGTLLKDKGNIVHFIKPIITFPVKPSRVTNKGDNVVSHCKTALGKSVPGFLAKANKELIFKSTQQLISLADTFDWETIVCPRFGCGAGELDWEDVKPMVEDMLDDRFHIYSF